MRFNTRVRSSGCQAEAHSIKYIFDTQTDELSDGASSCESNFQDYFLLNIMLLQKHQDIACNKFVGIPPPVEIPRVKHTGKTISNNM